MKQRQQMNTIVLTLLMITYLIPCLFAHETGALGIGASFININDDSYFYEGVPQFGVMANCYIPIKIPKQNLSYKIHLAYHSEQEKFSADEQGPAGRVSGHEGFFAEKPEVYASVVSVLVLRK